MTVASWTKVLRGCEMLGLTQLNKLSWNARRRNLIKAQLALVSRKERTRTIDLR